MNYTVSLYIYTWNKNKLFKICEELKKPLKWLRYGTIDHLVRPVLSCYFIEINAPF